MRIRKILVPISGQYDPDDPKGADRAAIRIGFAVGKQENAHVQVLCVTPGAQHAPSSVLSMLPGAGIRALFDWIEQEGSARRKQGRALFEEALAGFELEPPQSDTPTEGFSVSYVEHAGEIAETVGHFGRLSDLIVLAGADTPVQAHMRPIIEATLETTGKPVLHCPPDSESVSFSDIAIAWNDTPMAARAVSSVLDLLSTAKHVCVLSGQEAEKKTRPDTVVDYLAWHGISADSIHLEATDGPIELDVLRKAKELNADLVVIGASLHNPAYRLLFGSMTEKAISGAEIPVLMIP